MRTPSRAATKKKRNINESKKSRSETTHIEYDSQALTTKNLRRLNIPEVEGRSHSQSPISSDIVSSISIPSQKPSERSETSIAQTIEVHIDTPSVINTPKEGEGDEDDETAAAKKRDRSPSPATRKKERAAGKKREEEQERIAQKERDKREK